MGTTKVKALDPKAEVAKVNDYLLEKSTDKGVSLPMSFYVVSVKDRIQESTGNIMYPPYCYQAFSDEIETLRATDPKADLGPIYQNYDFMQSLYAGERSSRATAEATKDIYLSLIPKDLIMILFTHTRPCVRCGSSFVLFNNTPLKAPDIAPFIHRFI
jgi:hypothetical protein